MSKRRELHPNSIWDVNAVLQAFHESGIEKCEFHATRLWGHLIRYPNDSWHDVPGLPEVAKFVLDGEFKKFTARLHAVQRSSDSETLKLLLQLQDGLRIEAVVMRYDTHSTSSASGSALGGVRSTLCVSSQVGCKMGCKFCATGTMGLKANLTGGEIVEQLVYASQIARVRNVVFMGMGEPLDNYTSVKAALRMMVDPRLFALAPRHITMSTVGIIPNIKHLAHDFPKVSLALSLHAPNQALRRSIVPSAAAYKLEALMDAIRHYQEITGQKVFIEYVMLEGVNDSVEQALELGQLLKGHRVTVNLIPWNPVLSPGMSFGAPPPNRVQEFHQVLRREFHIPCTIRQEKGRDIAGACGQLVIDYKQGVMQKSVLDIEEIAANLISKTGSFS